MAPSRLSARVRMTHKIMAWTSALSVTAHVVFVLLLALVPEPPRAAPPLLAADVRLEVAEMAVPETLIEEIEEIAEAADALPGARPRPAPIPRRVRPLVSGATSTDPSVGSIVPGPAEPTTDVGPLGETEEERERRLRSAVIDPRIAAANIVLRDDPGPIRPSGPAGLGPAGETVQPLSVAEAEALHDGHLGAVAASKTYLSHTHPPLTRHTDGSYSYRGHAFTATIQPDGEVVYSDRGAVEYDLGAGSGSFDLGDMIMGSAGADPYAAERSWFEEEHHELIDRLVDEARARDRDTALRRFRGHLSLLWADRTHTVEARRRELFDAWDDSSEAEDDRAARDAVIAFIRRELPSGSEDAYPESEISALNGRRHSTERFAPY